MNNKELFRVGFEQNKTDRVFSRNNGRQAWRIGEKAISPKKERGPKVETCFLRTSILFLLTFTLPL